MNQLSKRLAKLESHTGNGVAPILILSIPSGRGEFNLVKDVTGNRVTRQADESEDRFLERARTELIAARDGQDGLMTLWVLRDTDEEQLATQHAAQLGDGHKPLRPTVSRAEWLRLHGLDAERLED